MITFLVTLKRDSANTETSPISVSMDEKDVMLVLENPNRTIVISRKDLETLLSIRG